MKFPALKFFIATALLALATSHQLKAAGPTYVPPIDAADANCRKRLLGAHGPGKDRRLPFSDSETAIIAVCQDIRFLDPVIDCMIGKMREDSYYFTTPYRAWHYCEAGASKLRECISNPVLKKHLKTTEKIYDACAAPKDLDISKLIGDLSDKGDWGLSPKENCFSDVTPRTPKPSPMPDLEVILKTSESFHGILADDEARAFQKIVPTSGMIGQCRVRLVVTQDSKGVLTGMKLAIQDPSTGKTKILIYSNDTTETHAHASKPTLYQSAQKRLAQFSDWSASEVDQLEISRGATFYINSGTGLAESVSVQDSRLKNGSYVPEDKMSCSP